MKTKHKKASQKLKYTEAASKSKIVIRTAAINHFSNVYTKKERNIQLRSVQLNGFALDVNLKICIQTLSFFRAQVKKLYKNYIIVEGKYVLCLNIS